MRLVVADSGKEKRGDSIGVSKELDDALSNLGSHIINCKGDAGCYYEAALITILHARQQLRKTGAWGKENIEAALRGELKDDGDDETLGI